MDRARNVGQGAGCWSSPRQMWVLPCTGRGQVSLLQPLKQGLPPPCQTVHISSAFSDCSATQQCCCMQVGVLKGRGHVASSSTSTPGASFSLLALPEGCYIMLGRSYLPSKSGFLHSPRRRLSLLGTSMLLPASWAPQVPRDSEMLQINCCLGSMPQAEMDRKFQLFGAQSGQMFYSLWWNISRCISQR